MSESKQHRHSQAVTRALSQLQQLLGPASTSTFDRTLIKNHGNAFTRRPSASAGASNGSDKQQDENGMKDEELEAIISGQETERDEYIQNSGWAFQGHRDGISIFSKEGEDGLGAEDGAKGGGGRKAVEGSAATLPYFRGEGRIMGGWKIDDVAATIMSFGARRVWDPRFDLRNSQYVQMLSETDTLAHLQIRGSFPVPDRDACVVSSFKEDRAGDMGYVLYTSVEDSLVPRKGKYRTHYHVSGWALRQMRPRRSSTAQASLSSCNPNNPLSSLPETSDSLAHPPPPAGRPARPGLHARRSSYGGDITVSSQYEHLGHTMSTLSRRSMISISPRASFVPLPPHHPPPSLPSMEDERINEDGEEMEEIDDLAGQGHQSNGKARPNQADLTIGNPDEGSDDDAPPSVPKRRSSLHRLRSASLSVRPSLNHSSSRGNILQTRDRSSSVSAAAAAVIAASSSNSNSSHSHSRSGSVSPVNTRYPSVKGHRPTPSLPTGPGGLGNSLGVTSLNMEPSISAETYRTRMFQPTPADQDHDDDTTGLNVSFVAKISPGGSLPASFVNQLSLNMPLCIASVERYLEKYGFAPHVIKKRGLDVLNEEFDAVLGTYKVVFRLHSPSDNVSPPSTHVGYEDQPVTKIRFFGATFGKAQYKIEVLNAQRWWIEADGVEGWKGTPEQQVSEQTTVPDDYPNSVTCKRFSVAHFGPRDSVRRSTRSLDPADTPYAGACTLFIPIPLPSETSFPYSSDSTPLPIPVQVKITKATAESVQAGQQVSISMSAVLKDCSKILAYNLSKCGRGLGFSSDPGLSLALGLPSDAEAFYDAVAGQDLYSREEEDLVNYDSEQTEEDTRSRQALRNIATARAIFKRLKDAEAGSPGKSQSPLALSTAHPSPSATRGPDIAPS